MKPCRTCGVYLCSRNRHTSCIHCARDPLKCHKCNKNEAFGEMFGMSRDRLHDELAKAEKSTTDKPHAFGGALGLTECPECGDPNPVHLCWAGIDDPFRYGVGD